MKPISKLTQYSRVGATQRGSFLLEALIALLIMAFGILGIVGLQAQSIRVTNDSEYRAEAVYLANSLIGKMWADDLGNLKPNYDSTLAGAAYTDFLTTISQPGTGLPGVDVPGKVNLPTVIFVDNKDGLSTGSVYVTVTVFWQLPGEKTPHQYVTSAVIGLNT
jgi:type IV pilus assembly protein PilV